MAFNPKDHNFGGGPSLGNSSLQEQAQQPLQELLQEQTQKPLQEPLQEQ